MITQELLNSIKHHTKDGRENRWSVMIHSSDFPEESSIIKGFFLAMYNLGLSYDCDKCHSCWNMEKDGCCK